MANNEDQIGSPQYALYRFKKWLDNQDETTESMNRVQKPIVENTDQKGKAIFSRLGIERLTNKITEHNSNLDDRIVKTIAKEFKSNGGVVSKFEDLDVFVEVKQNIIKLPKAYIKFDNN